MAFGVWRKIEVNDKQVQGAKVGGLNSSERTIRSAGIKKALYPYNSNGAPRPPLPSPRPWAIV